MFRRDLLKTILSALSISGFLSRSAHASSELAKEKALRTRVRPGNAGWPSVSEWQRLNAEVAGRLIKSQSLFSTCATEPDGALCVTALKNIRNPYWIGDQPAGTEISGYLDAWSPAPSVYAIKARDAADVAAGVIFARRKNLRLVVKGGGHSYLGTSNAPDSLLIWTRTMNKVTLHDAFVGKGCDGVEPVAAVSTGAGAVWMDLYNAVTTRGGCYVQGGGCTTVGVAGLVQSGGFGSFSKGFGTAASQLIEAEIVTADGQVRIVNSCSDPELFWAIKGGGGGSFGIVTRLTLRTHDLPKYLGFTSGVIQAQSDAAFAQLIARFIAFYHDALFNPHWGEQVRLGVDNTFEISMVSQGLDDAQAGKAWEAFFNWITASPKDFTVMSPLRSGAWDSRHWWDVNENPSLLRDEREAAPKSHGWWQGDQEQVGMLLRGMDSVWLPAALLQENQQKRLVDALFAASRHNRLELHINKGLAGAPAEAIEATRQTATNPAVVGAFTLVIIADGERPAYPGLMRPPTDIIAARESAHEIDLAAAELRKIVATPGSYVSESNFFNRSWQSEYWGTNYPRLRAAKAKYDAEGLFFVHHGVGSEDWSADGFTRLRS